MMKPLPPAALLLLWALSGCAHPAGSGMLLAKGDPQVCKHCNCYMPLGAQEDAPCTVCECGYRVHQCIRGR
ncbi:MAG: hypothetical protein HYZ93_00650 [Candidatus Omnitrophica bacterium]|nr:hypothetical protein [Candidatus Omnitrophota bacterium]